VVGSLEPPIVVENQKTGERRAGVSFQKLESEYGIDLAWSPAQMPD
jgi:hypothetical protein